ncbi:PREDICTED: uncharacterized protein LOC106113372 [Papilio xuthus]|uniref:Uncharacterized protein LOC106113372 n=1 Tax=Papilio xuthus TaxID=66420 RepID=A0AAJ7E3R1_PAPXU|nr:PREDICTED: uncharacterized protein LOC106113372 [Papilio xuthus]
MYRKFYEKNLKNTITCKICLTKMARSNMVRHFKLKHQFDFVKTETIKRKKSCWTRNKPSPWTKYSIEVGKNKFKCVMCSYILNMPKAHGNLKRHIKFKHPRIYEKETKENLKALLKQLGVNSEMEALKIAKDNEELIEQAGNLEKHIDEDIVAVNTTAIVTSDSIKEMNPMNKSDSEKKHLISGINENPIVQEITYRDNKIEKFGNFEYVNEDDEKFEEKIKWLADRAVPGRRYFKTRIWNFFNEIKKNHLYECKICRRKLAGWTGSSSNLKRHLALKHAKAFEIISNSPNYTKISQGTIDKLEKCIIASKVKTLDTSYFVNRGDNNYKCKVCDEMIYSDVPNSMMLFKHINEKHTEEIVGHIEKADSDDPEIRVVFLKKKDLSVS